MHLPGRCTVKAQARHANAIAVDTGTLPTWNSKYDAGLPGKQITYLHLISRASFVKRNIRKLITDL